MEGHGLNPATSCHWLCPNLAASCGWNVLGPNLVSSGIESRRLLLLMQFRDAPPPTIDGVSGSQSRRFLYFGGARIAPPLTVGGISGSGSRRFLVLAEVWGPNTAAYNLVEFRGPITAVSYFIDGISVCDFRRLLLAESPEPKSRRL